MYPVLLSGAFLLVAGGGCLLYYWLAGLLLDRLFCPARASLLRPWVFLFPALFMLGLYLVYPLVETLRLSLSERLPGMQFRFVSWENYRRMGQDPKFWEGFRNNLVWLAVVPAVSTGLGLICAGLTDRLRWGALARAILFMPMAISLVGASVIWKLVYDARPAGQEPIGVLNALYLALGGGEPVHWLTLAGWNTLALMVVLIWIQTGFATVILSAALRGVPRDTVEAAVIDGASPVQIFFSIQVPQIRATLVVVWTTITLTVLKVFDIVYTMTNGQWGTQVLANYMFNQLFVADDWGVASASAVVILVMVLPILVWNLRHLRGEGGG
ncbi:MAG: alpha-glucoside ABC transporter permease [Rhodobacterales bacterium]|nr:MAG: alpha-glucoside ABC transporter permease [Rhodobacterales bacterium]PIE09228.1 MAG: alpha-glucoside ABC transporter permease [Rhodobacterales bacterium]